MISRRAGRIFLPSFVIMLFGLVLSSLYAWATPSALRLSHPTVPLYFEVNQGQATEQIDFLARGKGYTLALTATQALLSLNPSAIQLSSADRDIQTPDPRFTIHMQLMGAKANAQATGLNPLGGKVNYLLGNDPTQWQTDIPTYGKVHYHNVYPGVDLIYYGNQGQLEYDFIVKPGADPSVIQLTFTRANPQLAGTGDLLLHTPRGEPRLRKPSIYQDIDGKRRSIDGGYLLSDPSPQSPPPSIAFHLAAYDTTKPLIIDPVLTYASFLGGTVADGRAIAIDPDGNMYITGLISDGTIPTQGAFQDSYRGGDSDAFVTKFDADGALVYSTYLGGASSDKGFGIAVDSFGNAYVTGQTNSNNFPTAGANADNECGVDTSCPTDSDAFLTRLNAAGSGITFSTFIGGGNPERGNAVAVDTSGNVYVTGSTSSSNFPGTNCFAPEGGLVGGRDVFIRKYDITTGFIYSCTFGGTSDDDGTGIAADSSGNAYIAGTTFSTDFPIANAFQSTFPGGGGDAFITKVSPGPNPSLIYSSYLGGDDEELGHAVAIDSSGHAYVTGETESADFPLVNAFQTTLGFQDAFVTKVSPSGSSLEYSTLLGGEDRESGHAIAVDSMGNAYVTGFTESKDFPTKNVIQDTKMGEAFEFDTFVTKLNADGSALVYSTYLSGNGEDLGEGIAVDSAGSAYIVGATDADDFPTTPDAFQGTIAGSEDAFVVKITESIRAAFESPIVGAVSGVALVRGWGFDIFESESISEVAFFLNGIRNTTIPCCSERKDIQTAFPAFPAANTLNSGWGLTLNWGDLDAGPNEVYVRLTSTSGDVWESEVREVTVIKPADSPFLDDFDPSSASPSFSSEDLVLNNVMVRDKFSQVESTVNLRYRFDEATQGLGLVASTTVAQAPLLKRWYASLGAQVAQWWQGTTLLAPVQAALTVDTTAFEAPLVGPVQGVSLVRGWAFDTLPGETITLVELFIDGVRNTNIPCCSERQDVANANPSFPAANTLNSGWGLTINWGDLSAGDHMTQIQVTSSTGAEHSLGPRTVTVVKLGDFPFIDDFDVSAANVSIDGQDIVLTGVIVQDKATQAKANITLRLRWSEPDQALTIVSAAPVS